ncbi:hypothetical protein [Desulforhopalus sp. 52FAK]
MRSEKTFIVKIKADIALARAALARFRVRGMAFTGEKKDRHDEHIAHLELKIDQINSDLRYRYKAGEHQWKDLDNGLLNSLRELQAELSMSIESLHNEHNMVDTHGEDDGRYPYGDLSGRSSEKTTERGTVSWETRVARKTRAKR